MKGCGPNEPSMAIPKSHLFSFIARRNFSLAVEIGSSAHSTLPVNIPNASVSKVSSIKQKAQFFFKNRCNYPLFFMLIGNY